MTEVKICGTRTIDGARQAAEHGADFLGFIFAPTRRSVSPRTVSTILREIPGRSNIRAVGVFVDESVQTVRDVVSECGLDAVQLHGSETPDYAQSLAVHVPVIKAFRLREKDDLLDLDRYQVFGYLVEPHVEGQLGGAGVVLDWTAIRQSEHHHRRLILSGGLRPDNVREAIAAVHPTAVDVSSGVERHGQHDLDKIAAFIAAVRHADAELGKDAREVWNTRSAAAPSVLGQ